MCGALALGTAAACANPPAAEQAGREQMVNSGTAESTAQASGRDEPRRKMALRDDCDPTDPTWAPTGGCLLEEGDVNRAEFNAFVVSPLSAATVGHPAWRIEPSYVKFDGEAAVQVTNRGGRLHTFTEVKNFGGGRVPPLNVGLAPAPECIAVGTTTDVPPGTARTVSGLSVGDHKFQCCIHPWMRAVVKVKPEGNDEK